MAKPVTAGKPSSHITATTPAAGTAAIGVRLSMAYSTPQKRPGISAPMWACDQLVHATWNPEKA